jgi:putative oxidoreductase
LAVGAVFIAHGGQKLFGLWGGGGLTGTTARFSQLGLEPAYPLAVAVGSVEFFGGILLVAGAFTLIASIVLALEACAAVLKMHLASGFFLNWPLTPGVGHGYEFHLTLIGALVCLMLAGPGALSFDARRASHAAAEAAGRARLRAGTV